MIRKGLLEKVPVGCLAEMETGGGKESSEGRNFEKSDTGLRDGLLGRDPVGYLCLAKMADTGGEKEKLEGRNFEERGAGGRDGWKRDPVGCLAKMETGGERGMFGKDGNRRGEGNAWQRWKQEGRRECLAKMETGGERGMLGKDGNRRGEGNA